MGKKKDMRYPVIFRYEVIIASEDGDHIGAARGMRTMGAPPTDKDIIDSIQRLSASIPDGFRLATPEETYSYLCQEMGMGGIQVACQKEWSMQAEIDKAMRAGEKAVEDRKQRWMNRFTGGIFRDIVITPHKQDADED